MRFATTISVNGKPKDVECIGVEDGYQLKLPKDKEQRGTAVRLKLTIDGYSRQFWKEVGYIAGREFEGGSNKEWHILKPNGDSLEVLKTRKAAADKVRENWIVAMTGVGRAEPEGEPGEETRDVGAAESALMAQVEVGKPEEHVQPPAPESGVFNEATESAALEKWLHEVPLAQTSLLEAFKAGAAWKEDQLRRGIG